MLFFSMLNQDQFMYNLNTTYTLTYHTAYGLTVGLQKRHVGAKYKDVREYVAGHAM